MRPLSPLDIAFDRLIGRRRKSGDRLETQFRGVEITVSWR